MSEHEHDDLYWLELRLSYLESELHTWMTVAERDKWDAKADIALTNRRLEEARGEYMQLKRVIDAYRRRTAKISISLHAAVAFISVWVILVSIFIFFTVGR